MNRDVAWGGGERSYEAKQGIGITGQRPRKNE